MAAIYDWDFGMTASLDLINVLLGWETGDLQNMDRIRKESKSLLF